MEHVKVSMIMPSLNVAPYIRECMESVVNQSLKDMEIICVDAGSTDGTWEILSEYAQKDQRITLIHSAKKSYGAQVNQGLDRATGEYIGIVETDDFIRQTMCETLVKIAEDTQADYVKADYDTVMMRREGGYDYERIRKLDAFPDFYNRLLSSKALPEIYLTESALWRGIYRRSFLEQYHIRLHESGGASYQDLAFILQTLLRARRAYYTDQSFYCYRTDRQEASVWNPECYIKMSQEMAWIWNSGILSDMSCLQEHAVKAVMMNSFLWSLGQTVNSGRVDINSDKFKTAHSFFCDTLNAWICEGENWEDYFSPGQWKRILLALTDIERFAEQEKQEREKQNQFYNRLNSRQYILFGCGKRGQQVLSDSLKRGIRPVAFCDNNDVLWNSEWRTVQVLPPNVCVQRYPDALYVTTSHYQEIKSQLLHLGISESQIINAI